MVADAKGMIGDGEPSPLVVQCKAVVIGQLTSNYRGQIARTQAINWCVWQSGEHWLHVSYGAP